jgi:hypothetical protein
MARWFCDVGIEDEAGGDGDKEEDANKKVVQI